MDPAALGIAAAYASTTQNAFVILTKCLVNNGALQPGQVSSAIKAKLNEAENRRALDYQYFQQLAAMLDEAETNGKR
jgi:membrane-bound lytic murein transglycosylase